MCAVRRNQCSWFDRSVNIWRNGSKSRRTIGLISKNSSGKYLATHSVVHCIKFRHVERFVFVNRCASREFTPECSGKVCSEIVDRNSLFMPHPFTIFHISGRFVDQKCSRRSSARFDGVRKPRPEETKHHGKKRRTSSYQVVRSSPGVCSVQWVYTYSETRTTATYSRINTSNKTYYCSFKLVEFWEDRIEFSMANLRIRTSIRGWPCSQKTANSLAALRSSITNMSWRPRIVFSSKYYPHIRIRTYVEFCLYEVLKPIILKNLRTWKKKCTRHMKNCMQSDYIILRMK